MGCVRDQFASRASPPFIRQVNLLVLRPCSGTVLTEVIALIPDQFIMPTGLMERISVHLAPSYTLRESCRKRPKKSRKKNGCPFLAISSAKKNVSPATTMVLHPEENSMTLP